VVDPGMVFSSSTVRTKTEALLYGTRNATLGSAHKADRNYMVGGRPHKFVRP